MAGADNVSEKSATELEDMIRGIGRIPVQQTTTYGTADSSDRRNAQGLW
jgi:FO synthase